MRVSQRTTHNHICYNGARDVAQVGPSPCTDSIAATQQLYAERLHRVHYTTASVYYECLEIILHRNGFTDYENQTNIMYRWDCNKGDSIKTHIPLNSRTCQLPVYMYLIYIYIYISSTCKLAAGRCANSGGYEF